MITFRQVSKSYAGNLIIVIPELSLPTGTYWMEGSNGSGKTTLLKILAGIMPFEGSISLNAIDLKKYPIAYRQQIAYAEAEPLYPPMLTGHELIRFVQQTRNSTTDHVQALITHMNISHFMDKPMGTYSSGMVKKLSLLLAFIGNPKVILLDEPLITLDTAFIALLLTIIRQKQTEGISFIITSHQPFTHDELSLTGHLQLANQTVTLQAINS